MVSRVQRVRCLVLEFEENQITAIVQRGIIYFSLRVGRQKGALRALAPSMTELCLGD
jgi:hypothetical protein